MSRARPSIVHVLGVLLITAVPATAQQARLGATISTTATSVRNQIGRRVTFVCPAISSAQAAGVQFWGTNLYTDDSPVCIAALHAGVLTFGQAGAITFIVRSGADSFAGSTRNGLVSLNYGPFGFSFEFDRSGQAGQLDWATSALDVPQDLTSPVVLECPAGGAMSSQVWGTGIYTADSSICFAGRHAGAVASTAAGGRIAVLRQPGQPSYTASLQNGVQSLAHGAYTSSFRVDVAPMETAEPISAVPVVAPPVTGAATGVPVRDGTPPTVRLTSQPAGFLLSWPPTANATRYTVCRESPPASPCNPVNKAATLANGSYSFYDIGVEPGTPHLYRVSAWRSDGHFGEASVSGTAGDIPPPRDLRLVLDAWPTTGLVALNWSRASMVPSIGGATAAIENYMLAGTGLAAEGRLVSGATGSVPASAGQPRYEWYVCSAVANPAGGWWTSREAAAVSYDGALGSGQVRSSTVGCSLIPDRLARTDQTLAPDRPAEVTNLSDATPPQSVTVTAVPIGVKIAWAPVAGAERYEVCRQDTANGACNVVTRPGLETGQNSIAFYDIGLAPGSSHTYRVRAIRPDSHFGESVPVSGSAGAVPAPRNVRIARYQWDPPTVELAWDPAVYNDFDGEHPMPSYQIVETRGGATLLHSNTPQLTARLTTGQANFEWQVMAQYPDGTGGWWNSPQTTLTYDSNHYRLVALGFRALATTMDAPVDADGLAGPGDEVFLSAVLNSTNRALNINSVTTMRSATYGADGSGRVRAGGGQPNGGLLATNMVPDDLSRWITYSGIRGNDPFPEPANPALRRFPLQLWEGTLDDQALVVVEASLWEADAASGLGINDWLAFSTRQAQMNYGRSDVYRAVTDLRDRNWLGPSATLESGIQCVVGLAVPSADYRPCASPFDRPIGYKNIGPTPTPIGTRNLNRGYLHVMVLSRAAIDAALATPGPNGNRPGVIIDRFTDETDPREGDYELYLVLQRLSGRPAEETIIQRNR